MSILDFDKISRKPPASFEVKRVGFVDFCRSNEDFFDEYFSDSVKINATTNCRGMIEVSPYGTSVLLREILLFVNGRSKINIDTRFSETVAYLDISWHSTEEPSEEMKKELSQIAENSNFEISFDKIDDTFFIRAKLIATESAIADVLAATARITRIALTVSFFH